MNDQPQREGVIGDRNSVVFQRLLAAPIDRRRHFLM